MTTYNTGNPLGSAAAKDLYDNAENLDHLTNDMANETWPDRLGRPRKTWYGIEKNANQAILNYGYITLKSFQLGAPLPVNKLTLPNQVLLDESSGEYYRWDGLLPKTVPTGSTPASTGGEGVGKWLSVGDASLRSDLARPSGAGLSGYNSLTSYPPNTVGAAIKSSFAMLPKVNISDFPTLKAAIAALPNGGVVYVPAGEWESGSWNTATDYMSTDNIFIVGERTPTWNTTLSKFVGGSVIKGRFKAHANNLSVSNVWFDNGKDYIDSKYPGADTTSSSHPDGGDWDAFAFAAPAMGVAQKRMLNLHNVAGLLYNSQTVGHAVLTECYTGGRLDNIIAIGGSHGVIIKGCDVTAIGIYTYAQSQNGLIIKADNFSDCGNVKVLDHYHAQRPRGTSPWFTPAVALHAVDLDTNTKSFFGPIHIGFTGSSGAKWHVHVGGLVPLADVQMDSVTTDGLGLDGSIVGEYSYIVEGSTTASRISIGSMKVSNCAHAVYVSTPSINPQQTHINSLYAVNITGAVIRSLDNARVTIDALDAWSIGNLYFITQLGKIYVGDEKYTALSGSKFDTTTTGGSAPALAGNWVQSDGNEKYEFCLKGYRALVKGFIASGTSSAMVSLPLALRPALPVRGTMMGIVSGNLVSFPYSVTQADGVIRTYDGTLPSGITNASLSGISWDY